MKSLAQVKAVRSNTKLYVTAFTFFYFFFFFSPSLLQRFHPFNIPGKKSHWLHQEQSLSNFYVLSKKLFVFPELFHFMSAVVLILTKWRSLFFFLLCKTTPFHFYEQGLFSALLPPVWGEMLHSLLGTSLLFLVKRRLPVKGQYTAPTDFHSLILLGFFVLRQDLLLKSDSCTPAAVLPTILAKVSGLHAASKVRFSFFSQLKAVPDVQIFSLLPHTTFYPSLFWLTFPFRNRSMWT